MKKVTLTVLGMVLTSNNLDEVLAHANANGIKTKIINKETNEIEFFKDDELGMTVATVEVRNENKSIIHYNATELHYNYENETYAIESDIHCTGRCPHKGNSDTLSIEVTLPTEVAEYF